MVSWSIKDTKLNFWRVYKEALADDSTFLICWDVIVGDLKNHTYPHTTATKIQYEDFASTIIGLWAMVQWDGTNVKAQG